MVILDRRGFRSNGVFSAVERQHGRGLPVKTFALPLLALVLASPVSAATSDTTAAALASCLQDAAHASTAGQTECESIAMRAYDARMNKAYAALMKRLPVTAMRQLRQAQRAWLAFRDAEHDARNAIYATRQGTMYVPMEAANATNLTRDRALQLETYLRVMRIDG